MLPTTLLVAAALSIGVGDDAPPEDLGRTLFDAHCARCHGADGSGQGTVELDRPARAFKDGGFSFGNTVDALMKTIQRGIPGTPMPGFDTFADAERRALAEYVRALGPPLDETPPDTIALVVDEARVVRGHLGPFTDGAPAAPRGMLVGVPSGLTFSFDLDDLRLRGVRVGRFVDRVDWTGRGGTSLVALGRVLHAVADGAGAPLVQRLDASVVLPTGRGPANAPILKPGAARPLRAELEATALRGPTFSLLTGLRDGDERVAWVDQSAGGLVSQQWSGFYRDLVLQHPPGDERPTWLVRVDDAPLDAVRTPVDLGAQDWRGVPDHPTATKWLSGPLVAWRVGDDGPVHAVDITTRDPWRWVRTPEGLHVALTHGRVGSAVLWPAAEDAR